MKLNITSVSRDECKCDLFDGHDIQKRIPNDICHSDTAREKRNRKLCATGSTVTKQEQKEKLEEKKKKYNSKSIEFSRRKTLINIEKSNVSVRENDRTVKHEEWSILSGILINSQNSHNEISGNGMSDKLSARELFLNEIPDLLNKLR